MIKSSTFRLTLGVMFGFLIASTIFLGVISLKNKNKAVDTSFWTNHKHEILQSVDKVASLANQAQLESMLLFSGTGSAPTAAYLKARDSLFLKLEHLYMQGNENPYQAVRIDSLRTILTAMAQFTDSAALTVTSNAHSMESFAERMNRNKFFSEKINEAVSEIKQAEELEHLDRGQENLASVQAFDLAFYWLLTIILMLLAATFFTIRHYMVKRTKMENELKKADDLYVKLFYESPIGLVICRSSDGLIIDCNRAFANLVNYSGNELANKTAQQLGIVTDDAHRDSILNEAQTSGTVYNVETQLKPKGKGPIWVSVSIQSVSVQNQRCLLCAMIDLTSHREAEEKMQKALEAEKGLNKMMSGFVTLASHEFRTPLSTILSSSFLIENYTVGDCREKVGRHLSRINSSVKILTSILDEFLLLSRIEEGSLLPRPELVDIATLLEESCLNLKTFTRPGQIITYSHTGCREVYTDPMLLASIVNNLVSNAIKFSPENTDIQVSSEVNSKIHVAVKDNGIGIPPQEHHFLFDRFYRASNAGAVQGTGIGLHLLKQYVELLDGTIELNSELGRGSEFRVTI